MTAALTITDLSVVSSTTGASLVDGVSFTVAKGELVGLVGESGSGKTTVGFACLGFTRRGTRIGRGEVRVADVAPSLISSGDLTDFRRRHIAYVPQSAGFSLNPALRIGAQLRDRLFDRVADESVLLDALDSVALPRDVQFLKRYPHQLSGGQQQRVVIAAALIARPEVVIFDEPTTGLDVATQAQIIDMIRDICIRQATAGLFISHDLAAVAGLCARTAVMKSGRLVEIGATAEVLSRPKHDYTRSLVAAVPSLRAGLAEAADETKKQGSQTNTPVRYLSIRGVDAYHGRHHILHNIETDFEQGECTAIVGESGSGKTTLCRSLIGLHAGYTGDILLKGAALPRQARRRSAAERRSLQYVFQSPYEALNPRRSVAELILQPLRVLGGDVPKDFVRNQLARVSLAPELADRYPHQLSGGERQRVAFARALAVRPELLICDEVTSALDVSVQAAIVDLIAKLRGEEGLTVLFVTHNLALVPEIAKNIIVMRQGRIVDAGRTLDILAKPSDDYTRTLFDKTPDLEKVIGMHSGTGADRS